HLVDGVIERVDQVFDVAAVERCDESAADGVEHLPRQGIGLVFVLHDASATLVNTDAALEKIIQRSGTKAERDGVTVEQIDEAILPRHQRLKPPEHAASLMREGSVTGACWRVLSNASTVRR